MLTSVHAFHIVYLSLRSSITEASAIISQGYVLKLVGRASIQGCMHTEAANCPLKPTHLNAVYYVMQGRVQGGFNPICPNPPFVLEYLAILADMVHGAARLCSWS